MGETIQLTSEDGFTLSAYRATPSGTPKGAVVVIQEIFGLNPHIRSVADGYAEAGYVAIAPALFDRIRPGIELGYGQADMQQGIELKGQSSTDKALLDIAAARDAVDTVGRVGVVGYCWGGFLSWLSACRLDGIAAATSYYGGGIASVAGEVPRCPVLMHFGERDKHITPADVDTVRRAHQTGVEIHVYPADHGFNCDARASYDAPSAAVARDRTLAFFGQHLAR
jgi:carboxymethylenebutenolidase